MDFFRYFISFSIGCIPLFSKFLSSSVRDFLDIFQDLQKKSAHQAKLRLAEISEQNLLMLRNRLRGLLHDLTPFFAEINARHPLILLSGLRMTIPAFFPDDAPSRSP